MIFMPLRDNYIHNPEIGVLKPFLSVFSRVFEYLLSVSQYTVSHIKPYIPILTSLGCNLFESEVCIISQRVNPIPSLSKKERRCKWD